MKGLIEKYAGLYTACQRDIAFLNEDEQDPVTRFLVRGFIELYEACRALVVPAARCPNCGYNAEQYIELHCQRCGCGLGKVGRDETTSDTLPAALEAVRKVAEKYQHDLLP